MYFRVLVLDVPDGGWLPGTITYVQSVLYHDAFYRIRLPTSPVAWHVILVPTNISRGLSSHPVHILVETFFVLA